MGLLSGARKEGRGAFEGANGRPAGGALVE